MCTLSSSHMYNATIIIYGSYLMVTQKHSDIIIMYLQLGYNNYSVFPIHSHILNVLLDI